MEMSACEEGASASSLTSSAIPLGDAGRRAGIEDRETVKALGRLGGDGPYCMHSSVLERDASKEYRA
jgi:hypothetical protein